MGPCEAMGREADSLNVRNGWFAVPSVAGEKCLLCPRRPDIRSDHYAASAYDRLAPGAVLGAGAKTRHSIVLRTTSALWRAALVNAPTLMAPWKPEDLAARQQAGCAICHVVERGTLSPEAPHLRRFRNSLYLVGPRLARYAAAVMGPRANVSVCSKIYFRNSSEARGP